MDFFTFGLIIAIVLGLGWGGFATMATYRLPRNMPWIGDKPQCFTCKTPLRFIDYVSILSFFLHRGQCRYCKTRYEESIGYFITETSITLLVVLAYLQYGFGEVFILANGLIVGGIIMAVIDAQHRRIPAKVLISMFTIGAVYRTYIDGEFYDLIFSACLAGLVALIARAAYFTATGRSLLGLDFTRWQHHDRFSGPGFDYVKLMIVLGAWLNNSLFFTVLITYGLLIIIWRMLHSKSLPVGSILTLGLIHAVLYPEHFYTLLDALASAI